MTKINYRILFFLLIIFSTYCAIIVGQSWDERFHLTQGKIVLEYFFSLGNVKKDILHREFYSPIYWTINHFLTLIFPLKYQIQISHLINLVLSLSTVIGFGKLGKELFNKRIGKIFFILLFFYPIFFGHMSINPKDTVLAFSHVWIFYLILRYFKKQNIIDKSNKYIMLIGFLAALATGVQFLFFGTFVSIFIFIILEIFFLKKFILKKFSVKKFFLDILKIFLIFYFFLVFFWIDTHENILLSPYKFFIETITADFWKGWPFNLINGKIYLSSEVPKYYFFINFIFKSPEYILATYILFLLFFFNLNSFFKKIINNYNYKLILISSILLIPLFIPFIVPFPIYDGLRLFLWTLPYFCIIPGLVIYFLYENLKKTKFKIASSLIFILFIYYIIQFIIITPYQYTYLNSLNNLSTNKNMRFENDYWGISLKELTNKINIKTKDKLKITFCGVNYSLATKYLEEQKKYKIKHVPIEDAEYIIMTNRITSFQNENFEKIESCLNFYKGEDLFKVERLGVLLSVFRKIDHSN